MGMLGRMVSLMGFGPGFKGERTGLIRFDIGITVPTDNTAGYEEGCPFLHTDGAVGTQFYVNEGTSLLCDFNPVSALTAAQEALLLVIATAATGTVVPSQAVIYDAAGKVAMDSLSPVAAGASVADATEMTAQFNTVTAANGAKGVLLPIAVADEVVVVINTNATNALLVYAITGSQINALGSTVAFTVDAGQASIFVGRSATLWYTAEMPNTVAGLTASGAELNVLDGVTAGTVTAGKGVVVNADSHQDVVNTATLSIGATGAEVAVTATAAELNQLDGNILGDMAGGAGFAETGTILQHSVVKAGGLTKTEIIIDLTDLTISANSGDIIGGEGDEACHLGQITAAVNGTVKAGKVTCLEVPAGADTDIDFYSGDEGTGALTAEDAQAAGLTAAALLLNHGAWAAGEMEELALLPGANQYLYLAGIDGNDTEFTGGIFLVELWGV